MIELLCGILIGIVMGLTGAGGALVAIPLFMQFMGQSLKEASVYSLVAVVLASLINFLAQRTFAQFKVALTIIVFSAFGSYLTAPLKEALSSLWIAIILSIVSLYALYNVWFPVKIEDQETDNRQKNFLISVLIGFALGALTTFTGLGGGVLMLPIFLSIYHFTHKQAVATSLLAVGLSSLSSLIIQINHGAEFKLGLGFIYLTAGILSAALILKNYSEKIDVSLLMKIRQVTFTIVVVLALLKIF